MHGKFTCLCHKQKAVDSYEISVIEELENFPSFFHRRSIIVMNCLYFFPSKVDLQARDAVRKMYKRCLAHHARWRGYAATETHCKLLEFLVRLRKLLGRGSQSFLYLRNVFNNSFVGDNRCDGIFAAGDTAALEHVWINISDELA